MAIMAKNALDSTDHTYRVCLAIPSRLLARIDEAAKAAGKNRSAFCRDNISAAQRRLEREQAKRKPKAS
jgi:metal-responsive CopG/Arc/MetJ family transcriptional regulator